MPGLYADRTLGLGSTSGHSHCTQCDRTSSPHHLFSGCLSGSQVRRGSGPACSNGYATTRSEPLDRPQPSTAAASSRFPAGGRPGHSTDMVQPHHDLSIELVTEHRVDDQLAYSSGFTHDATLLHMSTLGLRRALDCLTAKSSSDSTGGSARCRYHMNLLYQ